MITKLSKATYWIIGFIFLAGGAALVVNPQLFVPEVNDSSLSNNIYLSQLLESLTHISQEFGVFGAGLGAILIWAGFRSNAMSTLHYIFTVFFLVFAGIHWLEYFADNRNIISPLINSIPFILFAVIAVVRRRGKIK